MAHLNDGYDQSQNWLIVGKDLRERRRSKMVDYERNQREANLATFCRITSKCNRQKHALLG